VTTAASRDDSVVAIRQLACRGGGEAGERLSIMLAAASSKDGRRSAAGAESSRTGARPAAYSRVWNSWDLASVAAGFVRTISSKRSFAFSSSLQLVLGVDRLLVFLSARPVTRTSAAVPRGYWRARAGAAARDHRAMVATSGVAKS